MTTRRKGAALAGACLGGAVAVWAVAFHVGSVARFDGRLLTAFGGLGQSDVGAFDTARVQALVNPKPFLLAAELLLAAALVRRRPHVAVAMVVLLAGANLTSQLLKPLLAAPRGWDVGLAAWPSGHATAAMTLVLCGLLLVPRSRRPLAAAGGVIFALAVGGSILAEGTHFASDILGGYLVAGVWAGLAIVGLELVGARRPALVGRLSAPQRAVVPWQGSAVAGVATALAAGVALWQAGDLLQFAAQNTKFVVAAAAIALCAALLAVSRPPRRGPAALHAG